VKLTLRQLGRADLPLLSRWLVGDPGLTGRGLGPLMIAAGSAGAWSAYPEITAIVVAVQVDNRRSWRASRRPGTGDSGRA